MSVHYKFKSTLDFDTITFDGLHISVGDLKRSIVKQKHLGKLTDFDLQITNAQTKEEYSDDNSLIPKNTSLIIARVPLSHQSKKTWENAEKNFETRGNPQKVDQNLGLDISKMKGSEEEKIQAMMLQSTAEYDPKSYQKIRPQPQMGEVPSTYRCNKCKKGGHWIKNCPFILSKELLDVKRNTGIPKSFQNREEKDMEPEKFEQPPPTPADQQEVPEDLICSICSDLFTDAVMIPCCGSSFCDDCVRTALLESEDNECPDCKEKGSSPSSLIPNRFLRNSVNAFKNATGYKIKAVKPVHAPAPAPAPAPAVVSSREEVISAPAEIKETKNEIEEEEKPFNNTEEKINDAPGTETAAAAETTAVETTAETTPPEMKEEKISTAAASETTKTEKVDKKANLPADQENADSDFEDNITITMPPAQTAANPNTSFPSEKPPYAAGRNISHPKPPGIENSPQRPQVPEPIEKKRSPTRSVHGSRQEWEREFREPPEQNMYEAAPAHIGHAGPGSEYTRDVQDHHRHRTHSHSHEIYGHGQVQRLNRGGGGYQHMPNMHLQMNPGVATPMQPPHHLLPFNNVYNPMDPRSNMNFPNFVRQPFPNVRPNCMPIRGPPNDVRQGISPNSNLASVYQGVAAKVGTGIIDDPLEAFNRIMKQKEKRKEDRRRSSPDLRRSRSSERYPRSNRYRQSPVNRRGPREKMLIREQHEHMRDRRGGGGGGGGDRGRDRDRDKIIPSRDKVFRHKRSASFSDKSSRSKSWSLSPQRRRSRSPIHSRRSRSKPHNFNDKDHRNRGRSRGHNINRHPLMERKSLKRDIRSPISPKRGGGGGGGEEFATFVESSKKHISEMRPAETYEPPPPGFESSGLTSSYHWPHPNEKNAYSHSNMDDIRLEAHRNKYADLKRKESRSKSRSKSNENKTYRNAANKFSPPAARKSSYNDKSTSEKLLSSSSDIPEINYHKSAAEYSRDFPPTEELHDTKGHKYLTTTTTQHADKNRGAKKKEKEEKEKLDTMMTTAARPSKMEEISSVDKEAAHGQTDSDKKSEKHTKDGGTKSEKRAKEKKKKSKKEKIEKKKMKKDKKEKREKNKHASSSNEKSPIKKSHSMDESTVKKVGAGEAGGTAADISLERLDVNLVKSKSHETHDPSKSHRNNSSHPESVVEGIAAYSKTANKDEQQQLAEEDIDGNNRAAAKTKKNSSPPHAAPASFNCFDSVLDIHAYDTDDFDENKLHDDQNDKTQQFSVPALSRWELDEPPPNLTPQIPALHHHNDNTLSSVHIIDIENEDKVTNEVLRKAEHAIFARAINAIRPFDVKKQGGGVGGVDQVHRSFNEVSPPSSSSTHKHTQQNEKTSSKNNLKDFQITIPTGSSAHERSVELKHDKGGGGNLSSNSPKRSKPSIKERLGSKIVHSSSNPNSSADSYHRKSRGRSTSRRECSSDRHSSRKTYADRGGGREGGREKAQSNDRSKHSGGAGAGGYAEKKSNRSESRSSRHRDRDRDDGKTAEDRNIVHHRAVHDREKNTTHYNERDSSRKRLDEGQARSGNDYYFGNRNKTTDDRSPSYGVGNAAKYNKMQRSGGGGGQNHTQQRSSLEKRGSNGQHNYEQFYLDSNVINADVHHHHHQARVSNNPFRKKMDFIDMDLRSNVVVEPAAVVERQERRRNKHSSSSSSSDSEPDIDDSKRKRKHKDKKDRKRAKRSTSADSSESAPKKHKKKKSKSSKKKKKVKKHNSDSS